MGLLLLSERTKLHVVNGAHQSRDVRDLERGLHALLLLLFPTFLTSL